MAGGSINPSNQTTIIQGLIGGSGGLTKLGTGTLTLGTANAYGGATTVSEATFQNAIANALPTGTTLTVGAASGTPTYNLNGLAQTVARLGDGGFSNGVVTNSGSLAALSVNNSAIDSYAGAMGGAINLVKTGSGSLTRSGTNTYSGTTTVSAGNPIVNDLHTGGGGYSIAGGATLSGSGTVDASVAVNGLLAPDSSLGSLATGSQPRYDGDSYQWQINEFGGTPGNDPGWDLTAITDSLDLSNLNTNDFTIGVLSLTLANAPGLVADFDEDRSYSLAIVSTSAGITGFDAADLVADLTGFLNPFTGSSSVSLSEDNLSLLLNYARLAAIPEPGSLVLWLAGLVVWWARRRPR